MKKRRHEIDKSPRNVHMNIAINKSLPSTKTHPAMGLVFVAAGLFPLLIGLGLVHVDPSTVHAPLFVLTGVGVAFICAGLAASGQSLGVRKSWIMWLLGLLALGGFLTPFIWIVFGRSDVPIIARIWFGLILGLIAFIAILSSLLNAFPGLADRLGIRVIYNNQQDARLKITDKDDRL
jgi:hypothetical protein